MLVTTVWFIVTCAAYICSAWITLDIIYKRPNGGAPKIILTIFIVGLILMSIFYAFDMTKLYQFYLNFKGTGG